ncbi:hypothetical protein ON010_g13611 [Phytophthora cinnamomi]|nr:hypothetical protein ON010_g13611 [Phytophthora cinnamomi]
MTILPEPVTNCEWNDQEEEMKAQWEELDKKSRGKDRRCAHEKNQNSRRPERCVANRTWCRVAAMQYGSTVLHVAVRNGNNEMVSFLLSQGAELTAREEYGSTTLHTAVRSGNVEIVKMLLQRGASVNSVEEVLLNNYVDTLQEAPLMTALHVAACYSNTEIVQVLLDAGASITAVNKVGRTALHFAACYSSTDMVELLLRNGADIDSVDGDSHNPLGYLIQALKYDMDDKSIAVARLLCSKGSEANLSDDVVSSLSTHQLGLLECTSYWHHQADGKLADIPSEVINGGVNSVRAYLGDLKKPTEEKKHEILHRCKVCIVGPSTWGKTSFIRSMKTGEPSLEGPDGRTIGINRFSMSFEEGRADGVKRYEVTFWDFAGQDIYQVAHALFFSKRTLYLLCVDLEKYASHLRGEYGNDAMRRFFEERVLRWLVFVLVRQPEAQFKLIGTKRDLVSESELEAIKRDVKTRLIEFVTHPFVKIKGRVAPLLFFGFFIANKVEVGSQHIFAFPLRNSHASECNFCSKLSMASLTEAADLGDAQGATVESPDERIEWSDALAESLLFLRMHNFAAQEQVPGVKDHIQQHQGQ